jgi:predicted Fe-Mo cluster-binding NifX family protein
MLYTSVPSVAHLIKSRPEERVIVETVGERGFEHLREGGEDAGEGPRKNIG